MRYITALSLVTASLVGTACSAAGAKPNERGFRHVSLISMGRTPASPVETVPGVGEEDLAIPVVPVLPASFEVHNLSRRYVEFRMHQQIGQLAAVPGGALSSGMAGKSSNLIAASSSIAVPSWMQMYATVPVVSFVPGCAPLAYRPSGLLARTAEARRAAYYGMMSAVACEHGIPTGLFDAMIIRESGYNPVAISSANAFGLAQLMPGTAAGLGVNRFDPFQNMRGGARYLRQQLDKFGHVQLALAAYNAGPGRVKNGLVPRIAETQAYVTNIIANWSRLTAEPGSQSLKSTLPISNARSVVQSQF